MPHSHLCMRRHILKCMSTLTYSHMTLHQLKTWWSNFMHKVLVYCETWCVQFRFRSLTIPKSYSSMMLESCSYYFFAHRLSFCCQRKHSPRAGLEASRTPIMIADIQMAGLTISSSPVHTNVMVKLIDTRIYTVLMSVFAIQLRSREGSNGSMKR